jgi:hypothetical protein
LDFPGRVVVSKRDSPAGQITSRDFAAVVAAWSEAPETAQDQSNQRRSV